MSKIAADFGIHDALKALGIKEVNDGTSTGSDYFSSGDIISSYSPVDGSLIAKVKTTTKEDYEKVMSSATTAF
ncbi:MAG TPA: aldehyde dehydrogenase family protein, partial [Maribacter sp.]|nr:aldehyde dehydrogenase family protein [Maribacter sp.]